MELYINGIFFGKCVSYEQSQYTNESGKSFPGWQFNMENGKKYKVSFEMISTFKSNGKLEVETI